MGETGSSHSTPAGLFGMLSCLSLVMAGVYILNQMQDIETDRANHKLFLLSDGIISPRHAGREAGFLVLLGACAGFIIDLYLGLGLIILFVLAGWLYNFSPFKWKDRPLMGLFTNGAGGMLIYLLGWKAGGGVPWIPVRALAYLMAGVSVFLNTTLPDRVGDEKTGKITFVVQYGIAATAWWAFITEAAAVVLALLTRDWLLFIPGAVSMPLFVMAVVRRTEKDVVRATKCSILALVLAVCVVFPWYAILILFIFIFTKWYYKRRFNFDYPSLKIG
jgi:4-hydroxybenzoate polyprenyltransferase